MPIHDAVAVMNEKAGPIWAETLGSSSSTPFKVMRIPADKLLGLRLQIKQFVSLATMQLYAQEPIDAQDLYLVVPSGAADTANSWADAGFGAVNSLLINGFFAWAGADGKINLFIIGPTLSNALFRVSPLTPFDEFAQKFAAAYKIPSWDEPEEPSDGQLRTYRFPTGESVALTADELGRRTVVVWDSTSAVPVRMNSEGSFD